MQIANGGKDRLASALGWFSIGLGVAQVAAPKRVARLVGVDGDDNRGVMRLVGLREIACGVGILSRPRPAGWLWARVAGDVIDLMLLGSAMISSDSERRRVAAATAGVAGVAVLDLAAGIRHSVRRERRREAADGGVRLTAAITMKRPVGEVYEFWRNLENLPRVMSHLESVRVMDARRSHWVAKAPAGFPVEWDAETVAETSNELIAWRSLPGSRVDNSGRVRFTPAPGGRGTEIRVEMRYQPPGGPAAARIAKLFNEIPKTQLLQDLRRFKQALETGEVVVSDATIAPRPRPAQPPPPSGDGERARRRAASATAAAPSTLS